MDTVKVTKFDETHDRIICDPGISQEINDYFTFDVPGAKFMPLYKNRIWDGKFRIYKMMQGLLYCGLRTKLELFCRERNYLIEYDFDTADAEFSAIEAEEFVKSLDIKLQPRDYQMKAFISGIRSGRILFLSPTASGKSLIIYLITKYLNKKTLIIVPTVSLVHQMTSDFENYSGQSENIHKIHAGQSVKFDSNIVITTWQSVYKLSRDWFKHFDVVIGDEAHLFKAKSLVNIMEKMNSCTYKFGFTGTLDDAQCNKLILEGLFGPTKKVTTTSELIEQKHLADFNIKALVLSYPEDIKQLMSKSSYQDEIDFLVRNNKRNEFIKKLVISLSGNTLLLFQYVEKHGKILYDMISNVSNNRKVFYVHGGVDGEEREQIRSIVEKEGIPKVILHFTDKKIVCYKDEKVLLSDGSSKKASEITCNDDVDTSWIVNKYRYQHHTWKINELQENISEFN